MKIILHFATLILFHTDLGESTSGETQERYGETQEGQCTALSTSTTDDWCQTNCNHDPPNCPTSLCSCSTGSSSSNHVVSCTTVYVNLWDTTYEETETTVCYGQCVPQCRQINQTSCRPVIRDVCHTVYQYQCVTSYQEECSKKYHFEVAVYNETICTTTYKEDCEFHWEMRANGKVWVEDKTTCMCNPYQNCWLEEKRKEWLEAVTECHHVPVAKSVRVPVRKCHQVPDKVCQNVTSQVCQDIPQQNCQVEHKKVPKRVSRRVSKVVCGEGSSQEDGGNADLNLKVGGGETTTASTIGGVNVRGSEDVTEKARNSDAIVFG